MKNNILLAVLFALLVAFIVRLLFLINIPFNLFNIPVLVMWHYVLQIFLISDLSYFSEFAAIDKSELIKLKIPKVDS